MKVRRPLPRVLLVALVFAVILGALSLVVRRQSLALEKLRAMDTLRHDEAVVEAERAELARRLEFLSGRGYVVRAAAEGLGMRVPNGEEIVILPLDKDAPRAPRPHLPILARLGFDEGAAP